MCSIVQHSEGALNFQSLEWFEDVLRMVVVSCYSRQKVVKSGQPMA